MEDFFFKFLCRSQNIWTLMSAYPLNLAAFGCHISWYIYVLFFFFFLLFRILILQKKPKIQPNSHLCQQNPKEREPNLRKLMVHPLWKRRKVDLVDPQRKKNRWSFPVKIVYRYEPILLAIVFRNFAFFKFFGVCLNRICLVQIFPQNCSKIWGSTPHL